MPLRPLCTALLVLLVGSGCAAYRGAQFYRSGSLALERGEAATAIAELERAAQLVPQASEVQNHLGLAYDLAGRHAEARAAYARAVELDCDNSAASQNLAAALRREGEARP